MSNDVTKYDNKFHGIIGSYAINGSDTLAGFLNVSSDAKGEKVMLMVDGKRSHAKATVFSVYDPKAGDGDGWWNSTPIGDVVIAIQPNADTERYQGTGSYTLGGEFITKLICNHITTTTKDGKQQQWFQLYPPRGGIPGSLNPTTGSLRVNNAKPPKGWQAPK